MSDDFDPDSDQEVRDLVSSLRERLDVVRKRDVQWQIETGVELERLYQLHRRNKKTYGECCKGNFPDYDPKTLFNWRMLGVLDGTETGKLTQEMLLPITKAAYKDPENKYNLLGKGGVLDQFADRVDDLDVEDIKEAIAREKGEEYKPPQDPKPTKQVSLESTAGLEVRSQLDQLKEKSKYDKLVYGDILERRGLAWCIKILHGLLDYGYGWAPANKPINVNSKRLYKLSEEKLREVEEQDLIEKELIPAAESLLQFLHGKVSAQ